WSWKRLPGVFRQSPVDGAGGHDLGSTTWAGPCECVDPPSANPRGRMMSATGVDKPSSLGGLPPAATVAISQGPLAGTWGEASYSSPNRYSLISAGRATSGTASV